MSSIQHYFFRRYLSPGDEIRAIFHRHFLVAFPNILFWLVVPIGLVSFGVYHWFFPAISTSPFLWLFEAYLFMMFFIMLHKILDWYCDVWIITDNGIIDVRWSIFMQDTTFMEFHDISGIQAYQGSIFDKLFNIGDITLHKMGDEMRVTRMFQPDLIVEAVQANLEEHHHDEEKHDNNGMHIYVDGVRQNHVAVPYKTGFRYVPTHEDDDRYIDTVRRQPGTIDLSGTAPKVEEKKSHGHGH